MVSTRRLGIACLALLVMSIVATVSDADAYDSYTGVIADALQSGKPGSARDAGTWKANAKLELMTDDNTWDLAGHERELRALEGQQVTIVGAAHNGIIQVAAIYRRRSNAYWRRVAG